MTKRQNIIPFPKTPKASNDQPERSIPQHAYAHGLTRLEKLMNEIATLRAEPVLNQTELKAVGSLIAFVATNSKIKEKALRLFVQTRFSVSAIKDLHSQDYDEIVRFLVYFDAKTTVN